VPVLKKGNIVRHTQFGLGIVAEDESGSDVSVEFDNQVEKLSTTHGALVRISVKDEQARRKNTFRQETEEEENHFRASHWEPFYDEWDEALLNVQAAIDAGTMEFFSADCLPRHASLIAGIEWPHRVFYFSGPSATCGMRVVIHEREGQLEVKALFPYVGRGAQYPVVLENVAVWPGGVEAQIDAAVGGAPITFFDCRYGEHRNWYQQEGDFDFILSAIAYGCRPADEDFIDFAMPLHHWEAVGGTGDPPRKLSLQGAAILLPVDEWDRHDYKFRAQVQHVEEVEMLGQKAWLVTARVAQFDEMLESSDSSMTEGREWFELPIVVTAKAWDHDSPPEVGQDVTGTLWMQGYLSR